MRGKGRKQGMKRKNKSAFLIFSPNLQGAGSFVGAYGVYWQRPFVLMAALLIMLAKKC
jgi:hypothetical protein